MENERKSRLAKSTTQARRQSSNTSDQFKKIESQDPEVKYQTSQLRNQELNDKLAANRRLLAENRARFGGPSSPPAFSRDPSAFARLAATAGKEGQPSGEQTIPPEQQPAAAQQLQQNQQQGRIAQMKQEMLKEGGEMGDAKKKAQKEIRKQMNVAVRRGIEEAAQGIGNACDLGSVGTSTIITIFVYAFTLVDLNLQMASYYIKNETFDFFFPSLTWSPIPMPAIVSVKFLHIGLGVLDLLIFFLLIIGLMMIIIVVMLPYMISIGLAATVWAAVSDQALRSQIYIFFTSLFK